MEGQLVDQARGGEQRLGAAAGLVADVQRDVATLVSPAWEVVPELALAVEPEPDPPPEEQDAAAVAASTARVRGIIRRSAPFLPEYGICEVMTFLPG